MITSTGFLIRMEMDTSTLRSTHSAVAVSHYQKPYDWLPKLRYFQEFLMALDVTSCRDEREKLQWAFRLYDVDSSGSINREEVLAIMGTLEEVSGSHDVSFGHSSETQN